VKITPTSRLLIVFLCIALVLSLALSPAGAHTQWAIVAPFLIFFTLAHVRSRLAPTAQVQCQPFSLLSFDGSRAPPIA
jgi:hypothetical protein